MPRSGVEAKPAWRALPRAVREAAEEVMGSRVARAMRIWGGYAPTPTFRLRLNDGRRTFLKGVGPANNRFSWEAHEREERVYRELGSVIHHWAPRFFGAFACEGWRGMILEDLGPTTIPPWTKAIARGAMQEYAGFHAATRGRTASLPAWLTGSGVTGSGVPIREQLGSSSWIGEELLASDEVSMAVVQALCSRLSRDAAGAAERWFGQALPSLSAAVVAADPAADPALLHFDTRSDNLRWRDGRLYLLDWPHVQVGPTEIDVVAFIQSIALESGLVHEELLAWYEERLPLRPNAVTAALAGLAMFMAERSTRPPDLALPRIRAFQRAQFGSTLAWVARRLDLPPPHWLRESE